MVDSVIKQEYIKPIMGRERLGRRDFLTVTAFFLGSLFVGKQAAEAAPPELVDYFSLWEKRTRLENLQPSEGLNISLAEGTLRLEYQGDDQLFIDTRILAAALSPLLPRPEGKPLTVKDRTGWHWHISLLETREDFPESLRKNLGEEAKKALINSEFNPFPMEEACPVTFTLEKGEGQYLTYICSEPTGKLDLNLKRSPQEPAVLLSEKENPWLARSFRASFFLLSEILKTVNWGGPERLPKMPTFEILSPRSLWTFAPVRYSANFTPGFLYLFPAPADYQLPPRQSPPQPAFQI